MVIKFIPPDRDPAQLIDDAVERGLATTASSIVKDAKAATPVVTGLLQGSIQWRFGELRLQIRIGSFDVDYAIYVEGRVQMLAKAFDKHAPNLYKNIQKELES